ncbi:MAG: proteasome subunit beta [bacterium]|nr:proteasome subunit beta [bacterium]MDE0601942.1 proteasome subunit beta [bacterium]
MTSPADWGLPLGAPAPGASFSDLLESLGLSPRWEVPDSPVRDLRAPEATTVLASRYRDGVVIGGDRQATEGHLIAHRRMRKVYPSDRMSAVAVAGTAGLALEMVRLFCVELEHYEKIEGAMLSLEGKANFLSRLVRSQLPLAFQGLAVVPLFAGYDPGSEQGRVYTFDVVGGRYEEHDYGAAGSGAVQARAFLRTAWEPGMSEADAVEKVVAALVAAADVDVATGGPDLRRGILPNLAVIDAEGVREVSEEDLEEVARSSLGGIR